MASEIDRKYSVQEIDEMRTLVYSLLQPKIDWDVTATGRRTVYSTYTYMTPITDEMVESRLRTYMLNGTRPEELRAELERQGKMIFQRVR